ncbi:translation initiation factor IF3-4, chloroplastic [Humulus lupulus]|uniref:translation initiation factor IF3-4, chloroplastic n=1 Tax=Humulus lupulus TaxID=3486 RepID=UPI002B40975E|nr:translation initiation factor IF3-4, chloroplastic [Humulus lupulus]
MAGINTSCSLKSVPSRTASATKTAPFSFILSSFDSKLFGLQIRYPSLIKFTSHISLSSTLGAPITSRYGGGGGSRYSGPDRRSKQSDSDDDQALDLSSIRSGSVRLIDEQQNMVGVVTKAQAVQMADDAGLDLVILSPEADPPVVKIMDYNKYRYEQQKKKREQQKKSAASRMDLKELKMGFNIDQHDYSVRLRSARKFLKDGDKVKVIVNLKGRENDFRNIAIDLIKRFQNDVGELATEEAKNFRDRNIFIILVPNKTLQQKAQEPPKKKDNSNEAVDEVSASV